MDIKKLLRKYIQDKTMHYNYFRELYLKETNMILRPTDYERGYIAGVCHGLNMINRDLHKDCVEAEGIIEKKIGTGLKWSRYKRL